MAAPSLTAGTTEITVDRADAPHSDGPITGYDLRYSTDETSWTVEPMSSDPQDIAGLSMGTEYFVQTRAINAAGPGPWSPSASVETTAVTVPGAFEADDWSIAPGDEEADVTINSLPGDGGDTIIDIEYRLDAGSWVSSSGTSSFTISGLTNGQEYDVALRAVNSVGSGAASDTKSVTPEVDGPDLTIGLKAFWELGEASGARNDSHGSNHLTSVNAVGQAAGKVGDAASFTSTSSQELTIADNADLGYSGDFSFAAWFYNGASQPMASKGSGAFAQNEWSLGLAFVSGQSLRGTVYQSGGVSTAATVPTIISANTWYLAILTYTASTRAITVSLNAGTRSTATLGGDPVRKSHPFQLGRFNTGFMSGRLDQAGFWKRALTPDEEAWLYNSGNGRSYAEVAASGT
jgi:hypothetical protein